MALKLDTQYPGKTNAANASYPQGSAKNIAVPGDGTGTPLEQAWLNDLFGFEQALLKTANIVQSGAVDTALVSQYAQSVAEMAAGRAAWLGGGGGSTGTAWVMDTANTAARPQSLFNGMRLEFTAPFTVSGALTLDVFGLGPIPVRVENPSGAGHDLAAGFINLGQHVTVVYISGTFFIENKRRPLVSLLSEYRRLASMVPFAWVRFTGAGVIENSLSIQSVTRASTGDYTITNVPTMLGAAVDQHTFIARTSGSSNPFSYHIEGVSTTSRRIRTHISGTLTDIGLSVFIYDTKAL